MTTANDTLPVVRDPAVDADLLAKVIMGGDLTPLTPQQRLDFHAAVCQSAGLPVLTSGLSYLKLSGKMVLYATKETSNLLRAIHRISVEDQPVITMGEGYVMAMATMSMGDGRRNVEIGYVATGARPNTEAYGNAVKKAVTQAYRRCVLGLVGLGMLDESEVDTIPGAQVVTVDGTTGEIVDEAPPAEPDRPRRENNRNGNSRNGNGGKGNAQPSNGDVFTRFWAGLKARDLSKDDLEAAIKMSWAEWCKLNPDPKEGCRKAWTMLVGDEAPASGEPAQSPGAVWTHDEFTEALLQCGEDIDFTLLRRRVVAEVGEEITRDMWIEELHAGAVEADLAWDAEGDQYIQVSNPDEGPPAGVDPADDLPF